MAKRSCKQASRKAPTDDLSLELVKKLKLNSETKLTDLNCDCLYSIFKLLSLDEATRMCELSKKFVEPANWIVRKMSRGKTVSLSPTLWYLLQGYNKTSRIPDFSSTVYIPACRLKYIGQSITKLEFNGSRAENGSVVDSIIEHCTQLIELSVNNAMGNTFESIKTPIRTVEVLELKNSILGPVFSQLSKWLPKLRTLKVLDCEVIDESCIRNMETKMPALQAIYLDVLRKPVGTYDMKDAFSKKTKTLNLGALNRLSLIQGQTKYSLCNVDRIILANDHIKCLHLLSDVKPRRLVSISKSMKHLETLELKIRKIHFKQSTSINFKWVKKLVLNIIGTGHLPCPLVFDRLEELEITSNNAPDEWLFFARSNQLKKIKLIYPFTMGLQRMLQISRMWPSLTDISTELNDRSAKNIIEIVRSLSNIQRFNFLDGYCDSEMFNDIQRNLSSEFTVLKTSDLCDSLELIRLI